MQLSCSIIDTYKKILQHPVLEKAAKELQKHREQGKLVVPVFDDESSREHRVLHTTCSNCTVWSTMGANIIKYFLLTFELLCGWKAVHQRNYGSVIFSGEKSCLLCQCFI